MISIRVAYRFMLVAIGNRILLFDQQGNAVVVYTFDREQLKSSPVTTRDGELLVASETKLFYLTGAP